MNDEADVLSAGIALRTALKSALRNKSKNDAGLSERIVDEYVSLLKEVGVVRRKAGMRFGEWEVLK